MVRLKTTEKRREHNRKCMPSIMSYLLKIGVLATQNEKYRAALEWYANKDQWDKMDNGEDSPDMGSSIITNDYGERAREALK